MKTNITQIDLIGEVSTGDITYNDTLLLNSGRGNCLYQDEYSYLIYTPQDDIDEFFDEIKKDGFSSFYKVILEDAIKKKLRYIRIDANSLRVFPVSTQSNGFQSEKK